MNDEEPEGLTEYERWQVAVAVGGLLLSVGFTLWLVLKDDAGLVGKLRWYRDQQRRKREFEAQVRHDLNHVLFAAWEVMSDA
jgi:hypothetical protein